MSTIAITTLILSYGVIWAVDAHRRRSEPQRRVQRAMQALHETPIASVEDGTHALLQEAGVSLTSGLLSHPLKFEFCETVLAPGDKVTVIGRASVEVDPAGTSMVPRGLPRLCRIRGDERNPVMVARAGEPDGGR